MIEHVVMAQLADRLRVAGVPNEQIWELGPDMDKSGNGNSWKTNEQDVAGNGQSAGGYFWTDENDMNERFDGRPSGHTLHHTATTAYTPNVKNSAGQTKCNCYVGLRRGNRLYQEGGGIPTLALSSAGPADYSVGKGVRALLTDFLIPGIRFVGKQLSPSDVPDWFGNRYYWSTEVVLNGRGAVLDIGVRDLLIVYCSVISDLLNENAFFHFGHGQHRNTKSDLWDGRYIDMAATIYSMQTDIGVHMSNCPWGICDRHYTPPTDMPLGIGKNEHQGQCNVPDIQHASVVWAFDNIYSAGNQYRYDYDRLLTEGRNQVFEYRQAT